VSESRRANHRIRGDGQRQHQPVTTDCAAECRRRVSAATRKCGGCPHQSERNCKPWARRLPVRSPGVDGIRPRPAPTAAPPIDVGRTHALEIDGRDNQLGEFGFQRWSVWQAWRMQIKVRPPRTAGCRRQILTWALPRPAWCRVAWQRKRRSAHLSQHPNSAHVLVVGGGPGGSTGGAAGAPRDCGSRWWKEPSPALPHR